MNPSETRKQSRLPLRADAEALLASAPPTTCSGFPAGNLRHELQVHQIELQMQNEALRGAQTALEESRDRYVDLYEFAPVGYLTLNSDGMIEEINLTGVMLLGGERKKLLQQRFGALVSPEARDRWMQIFLSVRDRDGKGSAELVLLRGKDEAFQAQVDYQRHRVGADDTALCVTGTPLRGLSIRICLTDISERKKAESEMRIAAVAFASQNGMFITDPQGIILRVNPAFTRLTGYSAAEAVGQPAALMKSGRHDKLFYERMWGSLSKNGCWQGEIWNKRKNGQIYAEFLTITAIVTSNGITTHYVSAFTDITQDKEAAAEIHRLAYYDPLTCLPNRRLMQDRLGQALAATARSGLYGAIFFIDLDNFKTLNDTRGHDVGDLLLVEIAQRLRTSVREGDTVARQGGDEFVVLMEDLGAEINGAATLAKQLGDKLREAVVRPFDLNGYEYHCRLSIGVGMFGKRDTVDVLFKHADVALYQAKNAGRNTLRFFDPEMQAALDLRSALEAELRQAIKLDQLRLYYQPQVDAARRVIGVEALLRWQHPARGLVRPNDFIPLAEDTGLIQAMGLWVLETACTLLKSWDADARTHALQLAVNVSARQFRQADFVLQVQEVLHVTGANPARLKLELTESLVLEDIQGAITKMNAIKQLGVSFSMDDFGTGFSCLSYLAQLPLAQLKIDQSFVRCLPGARNDETIARTIISMGQGLAMQVIAEGVETVTQRDFLAAHGCHAYQGFLFSRPLPLDKFEEFLQQAR